MEDDNSCMLSADAMSCDAQIGLAKNELARNSYVTNYLVNHPVCERFNQLMDRGEEYDLLKTVGSSKKLCITKNPNFNEGPWTDQFTTLLGDKPQESKNAVIYTKFDEWTSAKYSTKVT
jgi:hypothetical protein